MFSIAFTSELLEQYNCESGSRKYMINVIYSRGQIDFFGILHVYHTRKASVVCIFCLMSSEEQWASMYCLFDISLSINGPTQLCSFIIDNITIMVYFKSSANTKSWQRKHSQICSWKVKKSQECFSKIKILGWNQLACVTREVRKWWEID